MFSTQRHPLRYFLRHRPVRECKLRERRHGWITVLEAVDKRHQDSFRYYQSGYPFEYFMVRFICHEKREVEIVKKPAPILKPKPNVTELY
jgi:hypothetical protein